MIKQLKRRVVIAAMISVTVVLMLIIGATNILNYQSIIRNADTVLQILDNNDGEFPSIDATDDLYSQLGGILNSPEAPYETRYFTLLYDENSNLLDVDTTHIKAVNDDKAISLSQQVLTKDRESGFVGVLTGQYRYYVSEAEEGVRITFLDCTRTMENFYTFLGLSFAISAGSLLIIFTMMMIFATNIIAPIAESYEKQKRFITDAGHDIKTPITIIDADREILEMDMGENEWLDDIKRQTKRLTKLTNDLIYLSRMEEGTSVKELSNFSLSEVCREEADSFSAVAKKRELEIRNDIEGDIDINGSEEDVRKLLAILFDNAIKYAKEGTDIGIKVRKHSRLATVTISNVAENMTEEHCKRMFDRFYRADSSRGSGGGFGIGLAMAQAIVLSHNGKISAELSEDKVVNISATFPVQYGSFKLITNFVEKKPKDVNNSSQNEDVLPAIDTEEKTEGGENIVNSEDNTSIEN